MADDLIGTDQAAAKTEADKLIQPLSGYCEFKLKDISALTPVPAGASHSKLGNDISGALLAWSELLQADAPSILSASCALANIDNRLAYSFLGLDSH